MQAKKHIRFDWAIKRLLRQKANCGILEGFLSELLKEDIRILEILDSESNQETAEDKYNRVDILVRSSTGELIIIEVQNSYHLDYFLRILYGISKTITEHMKEGDRYADVKKVISINIVYFDLGQGDDYVYHGTTCFRGIHDHQVLELTPAQRNLFRKEKIEDVYPEIYLIKVNKFDDNARDTLDEWIYFLKNSEIKQDFTAKGIREADEVLRRANMSDQERREFQRFVEVLSDRASAAFTIEFEATRRADELVKEAEARVKEANKRAEEETKRAEEETKRAEEEVRKAEAETRRVKEQLEGAEERVKQAIVVNLLNTGLSEELIAAAAQVSVDFVKRVKERND